MSPDLSDQAVASAQIRSEDSPRFGPYCLPGEGRDPYQPWAPAFAGVTRLLSSALSPPHCSESPEWARTLFHAAEAERQMWIGNGTFAGAAGDDEDARFSACFSFSAQ